MCAVVQAIALLATEPATQVLCSVKTDNRPHVRDQGCILYGVVYVCHFAT